MRKRRRMALVLSWFIALMLAGCADNPEKSVVKEKNMDKMLEEAGAGSGEESYDEVKEEVKKYETYQTRIEDKNLKVVAEVDAKVEIPEVEKLSVYRVSAKKIDQKFLDRFRETLTPEVLYYEGRKKNARTKSVIAKELKQMEKELEKEKKSADQEYLEECEGRIADLKEEYKSAPEVSRLTDYPSDQKIQSIRKLYDSDPKDTFFEWLHELHGDGEMFYGVSDGSSGEYHTLYMQNSANYGNCLRYECSKNDCESPTILYHADVENDISYMLPWKEGEEPDFSKTGIEMEEGISLQRADNEPLTLSEAEAEEQVNTLLSQLGLKDYACYEKGKYSQLVGNRAGKKDMIYRDVYRFLYLRKLDGVFVNNQAGFKLTDEWRGNSYVKKMWGSEAIAVTVNDNGIADFFYLSPLSVDETVVKKSHIKSFDEIKQTFEKMVVIKNTPEDKEDGTVAIKVTDVRLVYTRISEKDSFDTGLVVPVWDFEGTITDEFGQEETGNILSINAIDGSVIDQRLGY